MSSIKARTNWKLLSLCILTLVIYFLCDKLSYWMC